ncbi:Uncharacterised protein [Mycobacteroides abscessus subsp. abscessus]|uniref:Minor tail protein n=1 Tax=Mycobacteroides abscessus subsp. abscessus TaxID=1185650 RepID=A0AB38CW13_9MYCO|nr:hypothetical protein [Mycobacteroides abscessus]SHP41936.1 Uncharacterised protein [Mycobacteroides abscessus subsp. abscessus]SHS17157.1 Uncharacterised protein [Mycobacteroides abscessus subsp. abscessus]SHX73448.1 Uncharacterised protein [Mycobacteroides abscessus subsp. abscessus]SHZ99396.1 Uncharacterised protein [Mycobacteroides abscessus subsp. abscessus]SIA44415.1 Uncharacterised protein [Mycobacteroides abscessus subsp. abscessus]
MTMPSGVAGLDAGGWLANWVDGKGNAPDLSGLAGRTRDNVTDYYRNQVQGETSWQQASLTFFTNILHGFRDLGQFITLITKAITGQSGGLAELAAFVTQRWNDLATAFEKAVDSFLGLGWLRDALTGITGSTDHQVIDWIGQLLTAASHLDAGKVIGLLAAAVIPGLDASKIVSGQFAQSMVSGLANALSNLVDGLTKVGADLGSVIKGLFDGWFGGGGTGTPQEVQYTIQAIKDAVVNGYTVRTFTSSEVNWAKPQCTEMVAVLIGGGQNGPEGVDGPQGPGSPGGLHGSYIVQQLVVADLPAAFDVQVATAGNRSYVRVANGSHTGAVIVESGPHGSSGGTATTFGYAGTASQPGSGGFGAAGGNTIGGREETPGGPGAPSTAAAGGTAGAAGKDANSGGDGGAGGNVSAGALTKCGGGGGGGGGRGGGGAAFQRAGNGGRGGPGGYPGGGGGAGGGRGMNATYGNGNQGPGGPGAAGVVWLFYR